ncbi:MAG: 2-C-methyl-D-erythritol 2,4-cyclodiphosphate synthase [Burkholderiaceae bacterium]|jgi:2-C-methyl-D-erythritol 4-phosphate cytidylyltransferase/2-C-methyl-D-erythritol 2,4-cyclodiphosphate synthase
MRDPLPVSTSDARLAQWVRQRAGSCVGGVTRVWTILPAAGQGLRAGAGLPKQYRAMGGRPMLLRSIEALMPLEQRQDFAGHLVVLAPTDTHWPTLDVDWPSCAACAVGGETRAQSVRAGLQVLHDALGAHVLQDWVLVHDAARPWLAEADLNRLVETVLLEGCGGLLAMPVPDTVKRAASHGHAVPAVEQTIPREGLWLAQTPQMFRVGELLQALDAHPQATDEASAMEATGVSPLLIQGSPHNRKMTFTEDFQSMTSRIDLPRVGQGFDVHALVAGRPLILGGVTIPHDKGLLGHSDADVLLHAIADAALGAACLGDIGRHFPDTDAAYAGADSRVLLREVVRRIGEEGLVVVQVDATVVAQAPKLAPHVPNMVANIRADTAAPWVNVKATTTEHLGFTGREEGIAAQAVVMLTSK